MKTKALIKQFFSSHSKMLMSLIIILFFDLSLTIACPILTNYLVRSLEDIFEIGINLEMDPVGDQLVNLTNQLTQARAHLLIYVIALSLCIIGGLVFSNLRVKQTETIGNEITKELKSNVFGSVLRSDLSELEKYSKDDLKTRVIQDCEKIGNQYYGKHLIDLIYFFILTIACLVLCFVTNVLIGFVCLASVPILYVMVAALEKSRIKRLNSYNRNTEKQAQILDYAINNLKNIKIRNGIDKEEERYNEIAGRVQRRYSKMHTFEILTKNLSYVIVTTIAITIIFFTVTKSFFTDPYSKMSDLEAMLYPTVLFFFSIRSFFNDYFDKQNIDVAFDSLNEILALKSENRSEIINRLESVDVIKFVDVSHEGDLKKAQALNNVRFEVKKGERLGILGYNNSGKTVVADLCTKVLRPTSGTIFVNNFDLVKINTNYLRNLITYVPQNSNLLDNTIEGNVIYPLPMDEYKYNEALNKCDVKTILSRLPNRDNENIIEAKLSESEKQRISLANAIYKDSPVIILDDAFGKIEGNSKNKIIDEFFKLKDKILIIGTSAPSEIAKCDKVLILSSGKVLEYGATTDLLEDKKSVFYKMLNEGNLNR